MHTFLAGASVSVADNVCVKEAVKLTVARYNRSAAFGAAPSWSRSPEGALQTSPGCNPGKRLGNKLCGLKDRRIRVVLARVQWHRGMRCSFRTHFVSLFYGSQGCTLG